MFISKRKPFQSQHELVPGEGLSFLCKIVACSYRFVGINFTSCVACTKTTDQKKNPKTQTNPHPSSVPNCLPPGFCFVLETSRSWESNSPPGQLQWNQCATLGINLAQASFSLINCRNQGHFPIWILQRLLHILMSYIFYQTLTIIFRAIKLLHNVRGPEEIRLSLLVLKSRPYIYYVPPLLCPPKSYSVSFWSTVQESVLLCLQNLTFNARWHHSSSTLTSEKLLFSTSVGSV